MMSKDEQLTEEQIEKAVTWWADQIEHPVFDALGNTERNTANGQAMTFASMLATISTVPVTPEQRATFIQALRDELHKENTRAKWGIFTDYGPDAILSDAAKIAGINTNNFPWKTCMWFNDGKVMVKLGYGGEAVYI